MTAHVRMLVSTPLRPLATRMRELAEACTALDVATAFVSRDAVDHAVVPAAERGAVVRFLTGTFGNVTRLATFRHLATVAREETVEARVWDCGAHGNLHAKLYVWTLEDGRHIAWVGSANLTDGGLQNDGEIVAEIDLTPGSPSHAEIRDSFDHEWARGRALDKGFLASYREAPRATGLTNVFRRRRRPHVTAPPGQRMFVALATKQYDEDGSAAERIGALLGGTADTWYRGSQRFLSDVRPGDWCLYVDAVDDDVSLVLVTDVVRDGAKHRVFAHEPLVDGRAAWPLRKMRKPLAAIGLRTAGAGFRSEWVDAALVPQVLATLHPDAGVKP